MSLWLRRANARASLRWLLFFFSLSAVLVAQEKKEPEQRDVSLPEHTQATLPKIDLPEFLITGQETIDLPVSAKSVADEEKVFLAGSRSPGRKDVDVSAAKQQKDIAGPAGQMDGKVFAGFGNYVTPSMEGWFGKNYANGGILFHANFGSSNGHVANAQWQKTGLGVHGDYLPPQTFGAAAGSRFNGGMSFSNGSYRAYGSAYPTQLRSLNEFGIKVGFSSRIPRIEQLDDQIIYSAGISWNRTALEDSVNASESELGISANAATQWKSYQLRAAAEYKTSGITMPLPATLEVHSPQWFVLRFSGKTFLAPSLEAVLTVQQFVYRGNVSVTSGRFYPNVEIQYYASEAAMVFAKFTPTLERTTLSSFITMNKYMRNALVLRPTEIPLSLSLGSEISFSTTLRGKAVATYRTMQNFPVYGELNSAKVWDVMYLPDIRAISFDVQGSYQFSKGNSGTLMAGFNSTEEKGSSNSLPNIPSSVVSGAFRHSFDNGIVTEAFAEYVAKRWTDFAHSNANAGYVTIGGRGEYKFLDNVRALVQVNNLLNQQYYVWDGYVERPLFISLGVTYTW
jgi:outer membrane receptor protein involved in Fe transport